MKHLVQFLYLMATVPVLTRASEAIFLSGVYNKGQCHVEGSYSSIDSGPFGQLDTTQRYQLGSSWTERCRNCSCNLFGALCRGPQCAMPYDFTQEIWCLQWSEDGCCCQELGCVVDGETYAPHSEYPFGRGNPCLMCPCEIGASRDNCLLQKCLIYEIHCEDRQVTYDDRCCPHYTCPHGDICTEVPDPFPHTPIHELSNWYRGHIEPIPIGTTHHFHIDSDKTFVCRCTRPPMAECTMEAHTNTGW